MLTKIYNSNYYYDEVEPVLENYFDNNFCLVKGTVERWDGERQGAMVICCYRDFQKLIEDYSMSIYMTDDSLVLITSHHDGTNTFYIKQMDSNFVSEFTENEDDYCYSDICKIFDEKCIRPNIFIKGGK